MIIPESFQKQIGAHLMGNYLNINHFPLILAIIGKPGTGKTFQLREQLKALGVSLFSVSSADLECERAGVPAKLLKEQYIHASISISEKQPAAIVIDDIDTTVGEWEKNTGTVNHQGILAFLMHIADNPHYIEGVGVVNRVPVFFTGNNFDLLYEPLKRPGRTRKFEWNPTVNEKAEIICSIFGLSNKNDAKKLINTFPDEPIAFFSDFYASKCIEDLEKLVSNAGLRCILNNDEYKNQLYRDYLEKLRTFNWLRYIKERCDN